MRYRTRPANTTKKAVILHVDQVKVEGRSQLGRARSQTLLGKRAWPAFLDLDANSGSTSPLSHSSTLSLKRPPDPVLPVCYVVSANLVTVAIQYCLVSCGNEILVQVLARRVRSIESPVRVSTRFRDLELTNQIAVSSTTHIHVLVLMQFVWVRDSTCCSIHIAR